MNSTHVYYTTVAGVRDDLHAQAEAQPAPQPGEVQVFTKCPKGNEWQSTQQLEQPGKQWLVWLTSIFCGHLVPTGARVGVTTGPVHLWLAARQIVAGGYRVATIEEVHAELDRQCDPRFST